MDGYISVNGKARRIKAVWVGVNGKARRATRAWVGVAGKARPWFRTALEPGYTIRARISGYSDPDLFGVLRLGTEMILLNPAPSPAAPVPEVYSEFARTVPQGSSVAVGFLDLSPYGPTDLYVYMDGQSMPTESKPTETPEGTMYMSLTLPLGRDVDMDFVFTSTGGSMPMNTMTVNMTSAG